MISQVVAFGDLMPCTSGINPVPETIDIMNTYSIQLRCRVPEIDKIMQNV